MRKIVVADMGRHTIGERARRFLASLMPVDKDLLWELLKWGKRPAADFLLDRDQPRTMVRHLMAVGEKSS